MKALGVTLGILALMGISYYSGWAVGRSEGAPAASAARPSGPDPERVYTVDIGDAPARGPESAPVTIVEFSDFQCPFCARVTPTLEQIKQEYGDRVRLIFKHNPLAFHARAMGAHQASLAAGEQGKFWEMHDRLFADQQALDPESLKAHAEELGLDLAAFERAMSSPEVAAKIDADKAQARELGANGTPSFFINGRFLNGAQPYEVFRERIEAELAVSS